jgi:hypothetical protein
MRVLVTIQKQVFLTDANTFYKRGFFSIVAKKRNNTDKNVSLLSACQWLSPLAKVFSPLQCFEAYSVVNF